MQTFDSIRTNNQTKITIWTKHATMARVNNAFEWYQLSISVANFWQFYGCSSLRGETFYEVWKSSKRVIFSRGLSLVSLRLCECSCNQTKKTQNHQQAHYWSNFGKASDLMTWSILGIRHCFSSFSCTRNRKPPFPMPIRADLLHLTSHCSKLQLALKRCVKWRTFVDIRSILDEVC